MIGLTKLEVYNFVFYITEHNNRFELYTDTFEEFSFSELKDELEEILNISDITQYHLQHEIKGPRVTEAYEKLLLEKVSTDDYIIQLMGYAGSPFRDFESYLRVVVGLDEVDIQLILKQYNSNFVSYELIPGIYTIKDISETVYIMGDHEGSSKIENDDVSMKTKRILTRFGSTFGTLRFDKNIFFIQY